MNQQNSNNHLLTSAVFHYIFSPEIIKLIAEYKTSKEIAKELNISKNTVDTHRKNILEKAGLHKTSELIIFAIENGLTK